MLRVITLSSSGSVLHVLTELHRRCAITVVCGEGRPLLEGRRAAAALADQGLTVSCCTDAAVTAALVDADLVLVGADAVGPAGFLNKVGTFGVAAAASFQGVPTYVAATRDKFVMPALWPHLTIADHAATEVWEAPPPSVLVSNPYFELTPLELVAGFITDAGVLDGAMAIQLCESLETPDMRMALERLTAL
jgi:translation initiation factor 2B subunit (eIF-2B alpha/beta/delta family)